MRFTSLKQGDLYSQQNITINHEIIPRLGLSNNHIVNNIKRNMFYIDNERINYHFLIKLVFEIKIYVLI